MRKRSQKEKEAMGLVDPIFRYLSIKRSTRGFAPLLDIIIYAYANPQIPFKEIIEYLRKENYYVGISEKPQQSNDANDNGEEIPKYEIITRRVYWLEPSIVRTIETALESSPEKLLQHYNLEKLRVILQDDDARDTCEKESRLLSEIGEKYATYETHEERVIVYFCKKILKIIA